MLTISIGLPPNLPLAEYARLARLIDALPSVEAVFIDDMPHAKAVWPILHTMAGVTRRVHLGPSVTHPFFRHPLVTAGEVAALDEASEGRALLGIGRGDITYYASVGMVPPKPITAVREAILLIRHFLSGSRAAFHGEVFSSQEGWGLDYTPPRATVPIYVGTTGPRMFEVAGEVADGIQSAGLSSPLYVAVAREHVRRGAERAGRRPEEIRLGADIWTALGDARAACEPLLQRQLALRIPKIRPMTEALGIPRAEADAIEAAVAAGDLSRAASCVSAASIDALTVCGTPEDAIKRLRALEAAGLHHVTLKKPLGPDVEHAIRLIGEVVAPALA